MIQGDCLDVLRGMAANSIDAVVCDPPYGLAFMGKKWDYDVPIVEVWAECLRVLKPGGHLLAFAGTRTQHRMAVRIEDAGFEIRDMLAWVYGSGFPKSMDVSKAIDKAAGAERDVVGAYSGATNIGKKSDRKRGYGHDGFATGGTDTTVYITAPATDLARQWSGWGTALKPALEPITMARKPLVGTVAANVQEFGTGAINVDACRVAHAGEACTGGARDGSSAKHTHEGWNRPWKHDPAACQAMADRKAEYEARSATLGRWPANLIHDGSDEVVGLFPNAGGGFGKRGALNGGATRWGFDGYGQAVGYGDSGSAARFFYCAKASKAERESGLDSIEIVVVQCSSWENEDQKARLRVDTAQSPPRVIAVSGAPCNDVIAWNTLLFGSPSTDPCLLVSKSTIETATNSITESRTLNWLARSTTSGYTVVASCETEHGGNPAESAARGTPSLTITSEWTVSARGVERVQSPTRLSISGNAGSPADHPTVKPASLMAYLCRLVTPPGGTILDPFTGSGSTGIGAIREGFNFVGIEREAEYVEIARKRISHEASKAPIYSEAAQ